MPEIESKLYMFSQINFLHCKNISVSSVNYVMHKIKTLSQVLIAAVCAHSALPVQEVISLNFTLIHT